MKWIKTYRLFESKIWDKSIIENFLLDFNDKEVNTYISEGKWNLGKWNKHTGMDWVRIDIGVSDFDSNYPLIPTKFTIEPFILDLIDYMENCDLQLMDNSWLWNDSWQYYEACPNCMSDDVEHNYNLRSFTKCNRCEYYEKPEKFLLDKWPVDKEILEKSISLEKEIEQMQLTFSRKKSLYEALSI